VGEQAPEPVRAFASEYRPTRPRRAEAPIDEEAWFKLLAHDDDDPLVCKMFECVLGAVRSVRALPLAKVGLHAHDAAHPQRSSIAVVRAMGAAAFALDVAMPLTFVVPAKDTTIEALPTDPIASLAGARVTSGRSLAELAFLAGHHMARYRPAQYIRVLYADAVPELAALFAAAISAARPSLAVDASVAKLGAALRKLLEPGPLAHLERLVAIFVERDAKVDIARWIAGAERTALRAGLLLSGDIEAMKSALALVPTAPEGAMADLLTFAMSEPYFALRQRLGIALWPDSPVAVHVPERVRPTPSVFPPPAELDEAIARAEAAEASEKSDASHPNDEASMIERAPKPAIDGMALDAEGAAVLAAPHLPSDLSELTVTLDEREPLVPPRSDEASRKRVDEPDVVEPSTEYRATMRAALAALVDPEEQTEISRWIVALAPALRAVYARTPSDFEVFAHDDCSLFARALIEACRWYEVNVPVVSLCEGLGSLWSAPPSQPTLVLVDPQRDAALDDRARRWLAAECAAQFAAARSPLRLSPTPMLLADAVAAVARALEADGFDRSEGSSAHAVVRHVLADEGLAASLAPLARRLGAEALRSRVEPWVHAAERGSILWALFLVDLEDAEPEVFASRPFRSGFIGPEAWRAYVSEARAGDLLLRARAALAR
jgi:hypothetical protein